MRDLPDVSHRSARRTLTTIAPRNHLPRDRAAARPHARVPPRSRRGRRARRCALRGVPHADVGQPPRRLRRVPSDDAAGRSPHHVPRARSRHRGRGRSRSLRALPRHRVLHRVSLAAAALARLPRARSSSEHGGLARINVRSCMTCHDQQRDCAARATRRGRREARRRGVLVLARPRVAEPTRRT